MRKVLLTLGMVAAVSYSATAQQTEGEAVMGAGYANSVFYNLDEMEATAKPADIWDLAFYRLDIEETGIRINDAKSLSLFEASDDFNDWDDLTIDESSWTQLYNSETVWHQGAFNNGSADYGWGNYNGGTHVVEGAVIFVVKTSGSSPVYTKIKISDQTLGVYNFTYSVWNGSAWGEDVVKAVDMADNEGVTFNYFSFETGDLVDFEPVTTNWDFLFTQYIADYPYNGGTMPYLVTGVLQSPNVKVAQTTDPDASTAELSDNISTVGYDWKTIGANYSYTVNSDINYFVKRNNSETVYKVNFTEFAGSSTGVVKFNVDNTATLSVQEVAQGVSFDVYPNPSTDKIINVVYDITTNASAKNVINVYSLTGALVYSANANANYGFFTQTLDLSCLSAGMYLLEFKSGDQSQMKKIILK